MTKEEFAQKVKEIEDHIAKTGQLPSDVSSVQGGHGWYEYETVFGFGESENNGR